MHFSIKVRRGQKQMHDRQINETGRSVVKMAERTEKHVVEEVDTIKFQKLCGKQAHCPASDDITHG